MVAADTLEVVGIGPASDPGLAARFVTEAVPMFDALHRRFRILHNRWVSRHRHRERRPAEVPLEITDGAPRVPPTDCSAEVEVLDVMPNDDVKVAFAALPDGVRVAMYYVEVEGYTYAETAALMNVPMGTVMSRVSRGRQRLRVALSHMDHGREEFGDAEQRSA
jgi:DNA-directed RNA polymerase specialized sigma24 family protein